MPPADSVDLLPDELRRLRETLRESRYCLVDVRQPLEYAAGHLPGALLLPLPDLEARLFDLPADRALIFYCATGARSRVAADLALEAEVTVQPVHHLVGGLLAWEGRRIEDFPRVRVVPSGAGPAAVLYSAMDLEKGAARFYRALQRRFPEAPLGPLLAKLADDETAHARSVYARWAPAVEVRPPFETLFERLEGRILEGGEDLEAALGRAAAAGARPCLRLLELALDLEVAAYDLYRVLAEGAPDPAPREAFWDLAQAEKAHLRTISRALRDCPQAG